MDLMDTYHILRCAASQIPQHIPAGHSQTMANKNDNYPVGSFVVHPNKPEWGPGKILAITGTLVKVHFKNDAEKEYRSFPDPSVLRPADMQSDPVLDNLPPFLGDGFGVQSKRVSVSDGISRFTRYFPQGFHDPAYLSEDTLVKGQSGGEREYKWQAHQRFQEHFGNQQGQELLAKGELDPVRDTIISLSAINLLSPYEQMALKESLLQADAQAHRYLEALFQFIDEGPNGNLFEQLASALYELPVKEGRARVATWPVLTVFPFMADPTSFMFLKPEPTKECAARLRFDLQYSSELRWLTYKNLLTLSDELLERLKPLGARDYIDVQSFLWVIAKY